MRLCEANLPGQTGVSDGGLRGSTGAAVETADQHDIGMRLCDACCNRADTDFRDELHADARVTVRILQIMDQLGEIFDRIDVVMRRR